MICLMVALLNLLSCLKIKNEAQEVLKAMEIIEMFIEEAFHYALDWTEEAYIIADAMLKEQEKSK